jgi:hypothetical protein
MNFSWLLNGTMEAHHLMAVYLLVWLIQGGYALWIARQFMRTRKDSATSASFTSTTRDRS